ncbi:unnamed protein product [Blepharisma stoltei]|uniref:Uncharacterized protein n=1 Tax=Blepharisma stoltei TaxID=1481888 RepID=A0AAU9IY70_9CILI|nr:unnamed protein product [Blepharisma stoltei]
MLIILVLVPLVFGRTEDILYQFNWLNFTFDDPADAESYVNNQLYTCCMPAGIKMNSQGDIFISVPRWKENVVATLNQIVSQNDDALLLKPFPSLEENEEGVAEALQSVLGFEIDLDDYIWVLDQGKVNGNSAIAKSQKLVKYNSITGKKNMTYDLSSVTSANNSFLNDIVLDPLREFAYITDSGLPINSDDPLEPAIIVLNTKTSQVWRLLASDISVMNNETLRIYINGEQVLKNSPMETGADGIALSCDKRTLYYTPLTSQYLYSIDTMYLRDPKYHANISNYVQPIGWKKSASDGLAASEKNNLYITALEYNSVYKQPDITNVASDFSVNKFTIYGNDSERMMWPDTLGFNNKDKTLLVVANQLHHFEDGTINFNKPTVGDHNFYIWSIDVNDRSYLYGCEDISADNDTYEAFPTWAKILVCILGVIILIIIGCVIKNIIKARKRKRQALINN